MRPFPQFRRDEWTRLLPLAHALKQWRNDLWMQAYLRRSAPALAPFLRQTETLRGRPIAIVIAFEQPWALNWLLTMARRHLEDTTLLVLDNSRDTAQRSALARICRAHDAPYLALPPNPTRHVNRSHGMAMNWAFHHVVRAIRPSAFAFLDHDLIPLRPVRLAARLQRQPLYGVPLRSDWGWQLWAGYCLYDYDAFGERPLNFLYDFSLGLDTGGRNWAPLYRSLDPARLRFATSDQVTIRDPGAEAPVQVHWVDDAWFHIGGAGHNGHFDAKSGLCARLALHFEQGATWDDLRA